MIQCPIIFLTTTNTTGLTAAASTQRTRLDHRREGAAVNAMLLNDFLKEHQNVAEQQSTIAELKATVAQQQKQIEALTATVQKVSDQVALGKPAPQLVANP